MPKRKLQKFADLDNMDFVLQYPYYRLQDEGFPYYGAWKEKFFGNSRPIVIELGCGGGEYTVSLAHNDPYRNYIGIDRKGARLWKGAKYTEQNKLKNVSFLRTDINLIGSFFTAEEVSEIWITFPDPMMHKTKRRLVSSYYFEKYRKILSPQGIIHLKTDSPFLYQYTLDLLSANGIVPLSQTADLYGTASTTLREQLPDIQTGYEKQWLKRGMQIKYIAFSLPPKEYCFIEPDQEPEHDNYHSLCEGSERLKEELLKLKEKK